MRKDICYFDLFLGYTSVFPNPELAEIPIEAISLFVDNQVVVLTTIKEYNEEHIKRDFRTILENRNIKAPGVKISYFETDKELLESFFDIVSKCDTLSGYANLRFDLKYIRKRAENLNVDYKVSKFVEDVLVDVQRYGSSRIKNFKFDSVAEHYLKFNPHNMKSGASSNDDILCDYSIKPVLFSEVAIKLFNIK